MNRHQKLMRRLKSRAPQALDDAITAYGKYVFTIAYRMIGRQLSYEDAEEITSDVFFILWEHAHELDYITYDALKPYLWKLTINRCLMELRKKRKTIDFSFNRKFHRCEGTSE